MNLARALMRYSKDTLCEWSIGATYESMVWDENNSLPKPTLKDLEIAYKKWIEEREYQLKNPPKVYTMEDLVNSVDEFRKTPLQTTVDQEIKDIKVLINEINLTAKNLQNLYNDMQQGFNSIKGFLMMLPDIEKSLQDVKQMLQK